MIKKYKKKRIRITGIYISGTLLTALTLWAFLLSAGEKPAYVGIKVCRQCHDESKTLNQYGIWANSPHAGAVRVLSTSLAMKIARKIPVKNPRESLKCLRCHTTGGGKSSLTKEEGVGCESCHGPGSLYYEINTHVDFQYRLNGYLKAKKNGMYPILKYEENLKKREKLCLYCHRKERPCWPGTYAEIKKQTLTIQNIDTLKKGDVNFYHSLRRY